MKNLLKKGDCVEIIPCIAELQPRISCPKHGSPFIKKTYPQYGVITRIDGGLFYVKPKGRRWTCECFYEELKFMEKDEFEEVENYRRKRNE
jgi:hypothetical protein